MGILSRNLVTFGILSRVCTVVQSAVQSWCNYSACFASQINYKQFYNASMASNGLVISQVWSLAWQEHYSRVHVMSCHIRTLSPIPPTSDLVDSRWQPPCFTECWHSECHQHLSRLAFVLSYSGVSRPVLGALNVGYMSDCFQGSERQRTNGGGTGLERK